MTWEGNGYVRHFRYAVIPHPTAICQATGTGTDWTGDVWLYFCVYFCVCVRW